MNGETEPDYHGRTVYENAKRVASSLIERAARDGDLRAANPEWDAASEVYATKFGRVEQYMLAGGGPTEWLCFVFDADGDLDHAYLRYVSSGDAALVHLVQYDSEVLYAQVSGAES